MLLAAEWRRLCMPWCLPAVSTPASANARVTVPREAWGGPVAWRGAHAVTKTRSPSTSGRSHLTWSATASQTSSGMWSAFATCVLRRANGAALARRPMSDSLRASVSPARMPRTDASSIIARSRLGRSERGKLSNIVDTSAVEYADGTVECLWPGIWGTAAATSGPHAPTLARKRVKSRAT